MQISVPDRDGPGATALEDPIEDVATEDHFGFLGVRIPRSKSVVDHRFVSEKGILGFALTEAIALFALVVALLLLFAL